ncbi:unnamed protein product, partial [Ectocarpus sp. 13 AM-2016]
NAKIGVNVLDCFLLPTHTSSAIIIVTISTFTSCRFLSRCCVILSVLLRAITCLSCFPERVTMLQRQRPLKPAALHHRDNEGCSRSRPCARPRHVRGGSGGVLERRGRRGSVAFLGPGGQARIATRKQRT